MAEITVTDNLTKKTKTIEIKESTEIEMSETVLTTDKVLADLIQLLIDKGVIY